MPQPITPTITASERSPDGCKGLARAITWMFTALSTVEPPILDLATARLLEGDKPWSA